MTRPDKDLYVRESLPLVASMLQLLDRDPLSRTAGCFDRQYWHYRTMDFPCGMSQEYVLPLALAWKHPFPDNPYHQQDRIREWTLSGIRFARRSAHKDGSCDDYYPFERALGAAVFSLYAMAEAYRLVDGNEPELVSFLAQRARWVMAHGESGVLANHHAIAAAALQATATVTGDDAFAEGARGKARETLGHQHDEGWFREYEGFDPGYQTVTVDFLARYWKASGDDSVLPALERALDLLETVQHPDGTFGGEYAARNTYHTQPHGFEILAPRFLSARRVADRFLQALANGRRARNDDDRLQGHHVYPYLLAWLDFAPRDHASAPSEPAPARTHLDACGILVDRLPGRFLVAGLAKGGPFRVYRDGRLVANDSGPTIVTERDRVLVSHLGHDADVTDDGDVVTIVKRFAPTKSELMTPFKLIVLRMVMLTVGRWCRTLVRKLLQRRLITGSDGAPFLLTRRIERTEEGFRVTDIIVRDPNAPRVKHLRLGVGQTSMYIAVSQPWSPAWLLPWTNLDDRVDELNSQGRVEIVREW